MKPKLSKKTVEKLRAIQKCILAEPKLYDQRLFPRVGDACTSPCCIEGWAAWVNSLDTKTYEERLSRERFSIAEELGVTETQGRLLFSRWPGKFRDAWRYPRKARGAKAGFDRIEYFLQTGE